MVRKQVAPVQEFIWAAAIRIGDDEGCIRVFTTPAAARKAVRVARRHAAAAGEAFVGHTKRFRLEE